MDNEKHREEIRSRTAAARAAAAALFDEYPGLAPVRDEVLGMFDEVEELYLRPSTEEWVQRKEGREAQFLGFAENQLLRARHYAARLRAAAKKFGSDVQIIGGEPDDA
jgi:hypothetical protein